MRVKQLQGVVLAGAGAVLCVSSCGNSCVRKSCGFSDFLHKKSIFRLRMRKPHNFSALSSLASTQKRGRH